MNLTYGAAYERTNIGLGEEYDQTMTLVLYHINQSRSIRVRWLLEEMNIPYELKKLDPSLQENRKDSYLQINPQGKVPCLIDSGQVITESSAICLYLAEKYPISKLKPPSHSIENGLCLQWIMYAQTELEPWVAPLFMKRHQQDEHKDLRHQHIDKIINLCTPLDAIFTKQDYLLPGGFSVADIVLGGVLWWAREAKILPDLPESVQRYTNNLTMRSAFKTSTSPV